MKTLPEVIEGTGILRGLSCIPVRRGPIIRPLLNTTRREIEQYVTENGIRHVEDSSNRKDTYERNYVRHQILPPMEGLNPTVRSRIMSLLGDLTQLNERLDREAQTFLNTWMPGNGELSLPVGQLIGSSEERGLGFLPAPWQACPRFHPAETTYTADRKDPYIFQAQRLRCPSLRYNRVQRIRQACLHSGRGRGPSPRGVSTPSRPHGGRATRDKRRYQPGRPPPIPVPL